MTVKESLRANPDLSKLLRGENRCTVDIRARFMKSGRVTEAQLNALRKASVIEADDKKHKWIAPIEGRCEVLARVLNTRETADSFTGEMILKMLIRVDTKNGSFKAWGTVPSKLRDGFELAGQLIKLKATFKRAPTDEHFAFFKRPFGELVT